MLPMVTLLSWLLLNHLFSYMAMSKAIETHIVSSTKEPGYCFAPRRPAFGDFDSPVKVTYAINETVSFQCNTGYKLLGSSVLTCVAGGTWQPFGIPRCRVFQSIPGQWSTDGVEKRCSILHETNALSDTVSSYDAIYPVNFTITFHCPVDFVMEGPSQLTCDANGKWQPQSRPPLCLRKEIANIINKQQNWVDYIKFSKYVGYISIPVAMVGMCVFFRKYGHPLKHSRFCCPKRKKIPVYRQPSYSTPQTTDSVSVIESDLLSTQPNQNQFGPSPSPNPLSACVDATKNNRHYPTYKPEYTLPPSSTNLYI